MNFKCLMIAVAKQTINNEKCIKKDKLPSRKQKLKEFQPVGVLITIVTFAAQTYEDTDKKRNAGE